MERILMAGLPAHGLVQPSFPLVRALVDAGHTVDYLVPAAFHRRVEALGATPIGFAPYLDGALTSPKQLARHGRRMFADLHRGLLARADLCFTHAGFGSATDAVLAGVPPVLTPRGADQFFNAYRLAELDAGSVLTSAEFTAGAVRRAAGRLLAETPAGLAPLRASFATAPGPAGAVTAIERVL